MNPETTPLRESTFVLRRLSEEMDWPALVFPVLFALAVAAIVLLYRKRQELVFAGVALLGVVMACAAYFTVAFLLRELFSWWLVLVPTLLVAAVYICLMYYRDAHSVHFTWAGFLGFLRMSVYVLLGVCFLLPGCQEYETTVTESKVLVLFDVSGSMDATDATEVVETGGGVTRQEKIVRFLTTAYRQGNSDKTFLEHLQDQSAVTCYRFGGVLDDQPMVLPKDKKNPTADEWRKWLKPSAKEAAMPAGMKADEEARWLTAKLTQLHAPADLIAPTADPKKQKDWLNNRRSVLEQLRDSTDVGNSVLQAVQKEANSRIQAVIVISDGNSNKSDEEAIRQLLERAGSPKRPIHIITVGVGEYKQPVRIRVNPLVTPTAVRLDEGTFEIRVPVFGDGLRGEEFTVELYGKRVKDNLRNEIADAKEILIASKTAQHGIDPETKQPSSGEFPYTEVVFRVDLLDVYWSKVLKKEGKRDPSAEVDEATKEKLQGEWKFYAKVGRDKREAQDPENPAHVTAPKTVYVNDNVVRVLLFSSGPSRDYQFARVLLAREVEAQRATLSVYLQSSKNLDDVHQDVDGNRLLNSFPNKLEAPKDLPPIKGKDGKEVKQTQAKSTDPMNLMSYDVIISFDSDWRSVPAEQKALFHEWVRKGGGVIFVSGPQHTQDLIPPPDPKKQEGWPLKDVYAVYPVILKRPPANVKPESMHDSTIPYLLNFTAQGRSHDFLKLDDSLNVPLAGWKEFFGKFVEEPFPGGIVKVHPERGFYSYYPLAKVKDGAEVLATFGDPKARKMDDGKDQAFFTFLQVGAGKSFYIGGDGMWRLRTFKEDYLQRFWVKVSRFVSAGGGGKSLGYFAMAGEYITGNVPIEAELRGKNGLPLDRNKVQVAEIHRLQGGAKDDKPIIVELKYKKSTSRGSLMAANVRIDQEGLYEVRTKIEGDSDPITQTFEVKSPLVENADLRTNHPKLFNMATDAPPSLLQRLDAETRSRLENNRDRPSGGGGADIKVDLGSGPRLFFKLANANAVSQCVTKVPAERESVKGALRDLWDRGPEIFDAKEWGDLPWLVAAMFALPALLLLILLVLMLTGGRPLAAGVTVGVLVVLEALLLLVVLLVEPMTLFRPSLFGVLMVVPPLIALTAMGILLAAERYAWVIGILAATGVYLLIVLAIQFIAWPDWPLLRVDLTWMLILVGVLLSLEWFTRKMLRLA
jgi:hypothetical protein